MLTRFLGAAAPLVLVACAAAGTSTPASPSPPADGARARVDAWEKKMPGGHEIKRSTAGAFLVAIAHRKDDPNRFDDTGIVATEWGALDGLPLRSVVSADRDVDGDGRPDLLVVKGVRAGERDPYMREEPLVIADKPGGPVALKMEGVEPADWRKIAFTADAAIELRHDGPGRQVLAWNGQAIAPRETLLVWSSCQEVENGWGSQCVVVGASGKDHIVPNLGGLGGLNDRSWGDKDPDGWYRVPGVQGARFYVQEWVWKPSVTDEPTTTRLGWVVDEAGLREVDMPQPVSVEDRDGDGTPEIEQQLQGLSVVACKKDAKECKGNEAFAILTVLSVWDGKSWSTRSPKLARAYAKWLASETKAHKPTPKGPKAACPLGEVTLASRAYLAARWAGMPEKKALAEADRWMRGASTKPCAGKETTALSWPEIRKEMVKRLAKMVPEGAEGAKKGGKGAR
jgi:hypothetical protein